MDASARHSLACRHRRRGGAIVYGTIALFVLIGFASLSVDFGRVQLARAELQTALDAATLYGAAGLSSGVTTVQTRVKTAALENKVAGNGLVVTDSDIEFGVWNSNTRQFNVLTGNDRASATAIRVTGYRTTARNGGVPLFWGGIVGRPTFNIVAKSIACRGQSAYYTVDADSCPWLAGMSNGSKVVKYAENTQDSVAPAQSPLLVTDMTITPGRKISFRQVSGTTAWADGSDGTFGPDGDTSWIVTQQAANGINQTSAPIQCLVGIFLNNNAPTSGSPAAALDFSTAASRNFTTLSPQLKQVFFIGDGINSSGQLQEFVVPASATRLYIGLMDEKGWWWDNYGQVKTLVVNDRVRLVK